MSLRELAKRRLPYPVKQGFKYIYSAIPPRFHYGHLFWETYNFLQESQWWSKEKLQKYQMQQLSTLGIPLGFCWERGVTDSKEHAFIMMSWNRVGFKIGDRCVILRGDIVQLARKGKFWKYDPVNKNLILSAYHMTDEILPNYIGKIRVWG